MSNLKISEFTRISGSQLASGDLFTVVDISDTTLGASGTNKAITRTELIGGLISSGSIARNQLVTGAPASVLGRWVGSPGVVADISAGSANTVLARGSTTSISFQRINLSSDIVENVLPTSKGGTGISSVNTASTEFLKAIGVLTVSSVAAAQVVNIELGGGATGGTYFDIYSTTTSYRVWFNSGADSPPSDDGKTLIEISGLSSSDLANSMSFTGIFTLSDNAGTVSMTCVTAGTATDPDVGTSGLTISVATDGTDEVLIVNQEITDRLP